MDSSDAFLPVQPCNRADYAWQVKGKRARVVSNARNAGCPGFPWKAPLAGDPGRESPVLTRGAAGRYTGFLFPGWAQAGPFSLPEPQGA